MSTAATVRPTAIPNHLQRASPKPVMSITQTYYLAHKARAKLSREAAQPDHDLRLLVGHANLLDSLMLELADAEREQERWFNQSVRGASKPQSSRHIQWADRVVEESLDEDEYDSDSSSDSDSDFDDEEDLEMTPITTVRSIAASAPRMVQEDDEEMGDDLEEDYAHLELVRTPSHSTSPPELVDHDSESSDDESMPPSPADAELPLPQKDGKNATEEQSLFEELYQPSAAGLVSAISVY